MTQKFTWCSCSETQTQPNEYCLLRARLVNIKNKTYNTLPVNKRMPPTRTCGPPSHTPCDSPAREIFTDFFNFCRKGVPNAIYSAFLSTFSLKNHQNGAPNAIYSSLWEPLGAENPKFEFWVFGVSEFYFKIATVDFLQISIETLSTTFRSRRDLVLHPQQRRPDTPFDSKPSSISLRVCAFFN